MVTITQANLLRAQFIASLPARLDAAILSAAAAGQTSLIFSYSPETDANATTYLNNVIKPAPPGGGGWANSTIDTVNKTITVAP